MPVKIKDKMYVTVAERVRAIHDEGKPFSLVSEVLSHNPVVVKSTLVCERGTFTGISYANINKVLEKQSPYEVAETSAVGRALGFAGYGLVDDIATADEMKKAGVSPSPEPTKLEKFIAEKKVLRDTKGHRACDTCGKVMTPKEESYCDTNQDKFEGKMVCYNCQRKENEQN